MRPVRHQRREPPRARPAQRLAEVAAPRPAQRVGVPGGREQRRRADQDVTADVAGEVDAEERQPRVGHRVDQAAHQCAAVRRQPHVGAAERDDPRIGIRAGEPRQPVRPGARAEHGEAGGDLAARVPQHDPPPGRPYRDALDARAGEQLAARVAHVVRQRPRDRAEVDDRRRGRVQCGDPGGVRLDRPQPRRVQAPQAGDPVGRAAPLELVERGQVAAVQRDDQLPAALVGQPARLAVAGQLARPRDAQSRLQRAGRVVDPGVRDARVVAGLVRGGPGLALEHDDPAPRPAVRQLAGHGQAEDAGADHGDVRLGHDVPPSRCGGPRRRPRR